MPRVIGIDPGTVSLDLFGLDDGRVFLDRTVPTGEALADPVPVLELLEHAHRDRPIDLIAGPSGYGLPLVRLRDVTDRDLRLAYLGAEGEPGGIGGLRRFVRALQQSPLAASVPVVFTPGVIHLPTVPAHRKVNRVDMGTADKVAAVALALSEESTRHSVAAAAEASLIVLELGGAFTAVVAVQDGRIVDGLGGSSGPVGARAAGALDGEVAFLSGGVSKRLLFGGGVEAMAGERRSARDVLSAPQTAMERLARNAFFEQAVKSVASLAVSAPRAHVVVLSGRLANSEAVRQELTDRLTAGAPTPRPWSVAHLAGRGQAASQAAQGAAVLADGLAGGSWSPLVEALGIREARGTVLDHLHVIAREVACTRLGISG